MGRLLGPVVLLSLAACGRTPERTIQVQGTVQTVGRKVPIPSAEVNVQWPATLGAGQSVVKTNAAGRFAVGRTRRVRPTDCADLAITVQAPGYASAYTRYTADCGDGVLSFDFALLPQIR
jgi:hypothetical protein